MRVVLLCGKNEKEKRKVKVRKYFCPVAQIGQFGPEQGFFIASTLP